MERKQNKWLFLGKFALFLKRFHILCWGENDVFWE